jgi:isopentenyldiphosphate isomerase
MDSRIIKPRVNTNLVCEVPVDAEKRHLLVSNKHIYELGVRSSIIIQQPNPSANHIWDFGE